MVAGRSYLWRLLRASLGRMRTTFPSTPHPTSNLGPSRPDDERSAFSVGSMPPDSGWGVGQAISLDRSRISMQSVKRNAAALRGGRLKACRAVGKETAQQSRDRSPATAFKPDQGSIECRSTMSKFEY